MNIITTGLEGVIIIEPKIFRDDRGFFTESYSKRKFEELGLNYDFIQDNHSLSVQEGTVRGLHYQMAPKAQTKLVRVLAGAVLDIAIDIRKGSPTYKKWVSTILTAQNMREFIVPRGFAHGVCSLTPNTEIFYKVDEFYSPECDRCIRWDDPEIGITWPYSKPLLSDKDNNAPLLRDAENNFIYGEI